MGALRDSRSILAFYCYQSRYADQTTHFNIQKSVGEFPTLHAMLKFHSVSINPQWGDNMEHMILILLLY